MDKSLDDIINEQRTKDKSKRDRPDRRAGDHQGHRGDRQQDRQRDGRQIRTREPPSGPPAAASYWMHDDRDGRGARETQQGGWPEGSSRRQQQQQQQQRQWERPRGRGAAAATEDPIIYTQDGWEEVAQDPYPDRRGGGGAQRRGGVFDRLSYNRGDNRGNGDYYPNTRSRDRQQPFYGRGGGGGGGRGRGYDPAEEDAGRGGKRRYFDEHDHRDDPQEGHRASRFQPYSRGGGGMGGRGFGGRGRGGRGDAPVPLGKWRHDMFAKVAAAGGVAAGVEEGMME